MKRYALAIGISVYESPALPRLAKPTSSAEAVAKILERYGDFQEVRRLPASWLDADHSEVGRSKLMATELIAEFNRLLDEQLKDGGEALIYFSGHGFVVSDRLGGSEAYLAASDTKLGVENGQVIWTQNSIPLRSLSQKFVESKLNSLIVLLDCCHSGSLIESNIVQQVLSIAGERSYTLMAACRDFEKAYEGGEQSAYSVFTSALIKGLSREQFGATGGEVTSHELAAVIDRELRGKGQEPVCLIYKQPMTIVRYAATFPVLQSEVSEFNTRNPYLGLYAFEEEQTERFFGREQSTWDVISCLSHNRFLAVMGSSGSGKSSLMKAGVLPKLKRGALASSNQWNIVVITPGRRARHRLIEVLERYQPYQASFLLVIDQFEEVFTLCEDEAERRGFIRLIANEAGRSDCETRIVVVIRADFMVKCGDYPEIADLINVSRPTGYMVKSLCLPDFRLELEETITKPAAQQGVTFEAGLVQQIISDVIHDAGALPLLQYALKELWKVCIEEGASPQPRLTWEGYEKIGRVGGALEKQANLLYNSFSSTEQQFVRRLFVEELVQLGGEEREASMTVTRRRTTWKRLDAIARLPEFSSDVLRDVINQLVNERLVATDEQTIEVAHESLLSKWTLLRNWIEADRERIRLIHRVESDCRDWQDKYQRSDNALLTGALLAAVEEKLDWQNLPEAEYVEQSLVRRDRELQELKRLKEEAEARAIIELEKKIEAERRAEAETERAKEAVARARAERRRRQLAIIAGVLAIVTLCLGLFAQTRIAREAQQQTLAAGALIGKAETLLATHNELEALEASVEALGRMREINREEPSELRRIQTVISGVRERNRLRIHQGGVYGLSFSPDGEMLVSGGLDRSIKIWTLGSNRVVAPSIKHNDGIREIRFSPNGKLFASASFDGTVKIWDRQGNMGYSFDYGELVMDISFSSDNKMIAAVGRNKGVKIWDIQTREVVKTIDHSKLVTEGEYVYSLDFHPVKSSILVTTGSRDHDTIFWDISQILPEPRYFTDSSQKYENFSVKFSPDGNIIASCEEGGIIKLRDLSGRLIGKAIGQGDVFNYLDFSPDGKLIAAVGSGNGIKFWSVDELLSKWKRNEVALSPVEVLQVNTGTLRRISFRGKSYTKKGMIVATSDTGGSIRLWELFNYGSANQEKYTLVDLLDKGCSVLSKQAREYAKSREVSKLCTNVIGD